MLPVALNANASSTPLPLRRSLAIKTVSVHESNHIVIPDLLAAGRRSEDSALAIIWLSAPALSVRSSCPLLFRPPLLGPMRRFHGALPVRRGGHARLHAILSPGISLYTIANSWLPVPASDRKSTRLNSSHGYISYA